MGPTSLEATAVRPYDQTRRYHGASSSKILGFKNAPWRWATGTEAGVAIALTSGSLSLAGKASIGLIASLGAFTILLFSTAEPRKRAKALPVVAVGLICASLVGVACAGSIVWTVAGLVFVAGSGMSLMLGFRAGAPGALMFVLVAGVSGHIAASTPDASSIPWLVGFGCLVAYVVAVTPLWSVKRRRSRGVEAPRQNAPKWLFTAADRRVVTQVILAAGLSGACGARLGSEHVYWAIVSSVAVLQTQQARSII